MMSFSKGKVRFTKCQVAAIPGKVRSQMRGAKSRAAPGRQQMRARRPPPFADMSAAVTLRLATAWSGAVAVLLFILVLARLFS